jgi:transcriptional antiterminator NusG
MAELYSARLETVSGTDQTSLAPTSSERPWYAVYTRVNQEKRVAESLQKRDVVSFTPLYSCLRRRTDRVVRLSRPLFPGYVFVQMDTGKRLQILQTANVIRFVEFGGIPAVLARNEIEVLRNAPPHKLEPHTFLRVGQRVRIVDGPFVGLEGILSRRRGPMRVIISIETIMRSFAVEVQSTDVEPVRTRDGLRNDPRRLSPAPSIRFAA